MPHQHIAQVESSRVAWVIGGDRLVVVEGVGQPEALSKYCWAAAGAGRDLVAQVAQVVVEGHGRADRRWRWACPGVVVMLLVRLLGHGRRRARPAAARPAASARPNDRRNIVSRIPFSLGELRAPKDFPGGGSKCQPARASGDAPGTARVGAETGHRGLGAGHGGIWALDPI